MAPAPETPVQLQRLIKVLSPHITQALRGVRSAYGGYSDSDVIGTCRESAGDLAATLGSILGITVTGRQLCLICLDNESWAERQAWERLLAHIAVLSAIGPSGPGSYSQGGDGADEMPEEIAG